MSIPNILLNSLKIEYQTSGISRKALADKYNYSESDIPFDDWESGVQLNASLDTPTNISTEKKLVIDVKPSKETGLPSIKYEAPSNLNSNLPSTDIDKDEDTDEDEDSKNLRKDINKVAKDLLDKITEVIDDSYEITPKEVKDLAATLVSLKEATIGKDPTVRIDMNNTSVIQHNTLSQILNVIKTTPKDC